MRGSRKIFQEGSELKIGGEGAFGNYQKSWQAKKNQITKIIIFLIREKRGRTKYTYNSNKNSYLGKNKIP